MSTYHMPSLTHRPALTSSRCAMLAMGGLAIACAPASAQIWRSWDTVYTNTTAVNDLITHDPDGDGPAQEQVIAIRNGQLIEAWDGQTWTTILDAPAGDLQSLASFDPDGSGPMNPLLIAGGQFDDIDGTPATDLAAWDGAAWIPIDGVVDSVFGSVGWLDTWDPDGDGPADEVLLANGTFTETANGTSIFGLAAWDGANWSPVGARMRLGSGNPVIKDAAAFDPDGDGPLPRSLILCGDITSIGATPVSSGLVIWDGSTIAPLNIDGPIQPFNILSANSLAVLDADGPGGDAPLLYFAGRFRDEADEFPVTRHTVVKWDGQTWSPDILVSNSERMYGIEVFDPDGDGPAPERLIQLVDDFREQPRSRVRATDGTSSSFFGSGFDDLVLHAVVHTPSGAGGPSALVVAGDFSTVDSLAVTRLAYWSTVDLLPADGTCAADLSGDDVLNNTDINLFVSAFLANDPAADLSNDGVYNNTDINLFVSAFLAGCD